MQNTKLDSYYKILSKRLDIYYKSRNEITLRDRHGGGGGLEVRRITQRDEQHGVMNGTGLDLPLPLW